MSTPFKCYIGWDKKDILAYEVCVESLIEHSTLDLEVIPLHEWKLRNQKLYWRSYVVDTNGQMVDRGDRSKFSTDFSFTRFLVPAINKYADEWVLFCDADMLWRADIADLVSLVDDKYDVMCVQHEHIPFETHKLNGLEQTKYRRKNWSSLMLMNTARCNGLTLYAVNNWTGDALHSFTWTQNIGALPQAWNYLEGYTDPQICASPSVVHFTLGTPDIVNTPYKYSSEWQAYADAISIYGDGPKVVRGAE